LFLGIQELQVRKIKFDTDFAAGEIDFGLAEVRQAGPLHVQGEAELLNDTLGEVRIRGRMNVDLSLQCDRCLEPVRYSVDGPFDLFYRPTPKGSLPHEVAIDEGESQIGFYEGGGMALEDVLREHVLLSLPMHQVCREECAGICPKCGVNRNTGQCACTEEVVDDRWAALRELRGSLRDSR
jgi:uncharacterized protein